MKETDSCPGRQAWANVSLLLSPLPPLEGGGNWAHTSTILCLPKLVLKPVFLWDLSVHPPYPSPTLLSPEHKSTEHMRLLQPHLELLPIFLYLVLSHRLYVPIDDFLGRWQWVWRKMTETDSRVMGTG